jgi:hypothetical protein
MSSGQKTLRESLKLKGGLPGLSPLRSDGSHASQAGRLDRVSWNHSDAIDPCEGQVSTEEPSV